MIFRFVRDSRSNKKKSSWCPVFVNPGPQWASVLQLVWKHRWRVAVVGLWLPSSFVWKSAQDVTELFVCVRSTSVTTGAADGELLLLHRHCLRAEDSCCLLCVCGLPGAVSSVIHTGCVCCLCMRCINGVSVGRHLRLHTAENCTDGNSKALFFPRGKISAFSVSGSVSLAWSVPHCFLQQIICTCWNALICLKREVTFFQYVLNHEMQRSANQAQSDCQWLSRPLWWVQHWQLRTSQQLITHLRGSIQWFV